MAKTKLFPAKILPVRVRNEFAERNIEIKGVRDARVGVPLHVTPNDVRRGKPKDPFACAGVKCAVRQEGVDAALIRKRVAYLVRKGIATRFNVPPAVRQELVLFDRMGKFEPGTYELRPPTATQRLGADTRRKRATGPKHKRRVDHGLTLPRHVTVGTRW